MHYPRLALAAAMLAVLALASRAAAEEPPNYTYDVSAPGTIVQNQLLYLAGDAMHSQWRAIVSKKLLGKANGTAFYQWYLSIYAIDGTTYKLKYQSPRDGGPLSVVTKPSGADLWLPVQSVKIDAPVQLVAQGKDNLVVESHEMAADCGGAIVSVFAADDAGKVVPAVSARNGCDLTAQPVNSKAGASLTLIGPYYGPNAAMCCPTKPKASATLRYANGKWVETPDYYELFVGKLPPQ
jgi:hypothetical protein